MEKLFLLLILFQVKHFLADFPLQSQYMLGKFKPTDWVMPLAAHCSVHFAFTLCIMMYFAPAFWWLAFIDFVIHFIMDRIKASPNLLGKYKSLTAKEYIHYKQTEDLLSFDEVTNDYVRHSVFLKRNTFFWWSLGLDQMVHHLTHYLILWIIL